MRNIDLTGQRFGMLTVICKTGQKFRSTYLYKCRCDCGGEKLVPGYLLKNNNTRSCGCLKLTAHIVDATGFRNGRLVAVRPTGRIVNKSAEWECRCDCGNTTLATLHSLRLNTRRCCERCAAAVKSEQAKSMRSLVKTTDYGANVARMKNIMNGIVCKNNSSGVTGVTYNAIHKKWRARIGYKGRVISLGEYSDYNDAVKARKDAEHRLWQGEIEEETNDNP